MWIESVINLILQLVLPFVKTLETTLTNTTVISDMPCWGINWRCILKKAVTPKTTQTACGLIFISNTWRVIAMLPLLPLAAGMLMLSLLFVFASPYSCLCTVISHLLVSQSDTLNMNGTLPANMNKTQQFQKHPDQDRPSTLQYRMNKLN